MDKNTATVTLTKDKDCKGCVRFQTHDTKAPMTSAYISRAMNGINDAEKVKITIEIIN